MLKIPCPCKTNRVNLIGWSSQMSKIIPMFVLILLTSASGYAQSWYAGIGGSIMPFFSRTEPVTQDYSNLLSVGGLLRADFGRPIPVTLGAEFRYSNKELANYQPPAQPNAPDGTGPSLGLEQSLKVFRYELPILYRVVQAKEYSIRAGIHVGVGVLKETDKIIYYDMKSGSYLYDHSGQASGTGFLASPSLEFRIAAWQPFDVVVGLNYQVFQPSITFDSNPASSLVDPKTGYNPTIISSLSTVTSYNMNGVGLDLTILYAL